MGELAGINFKSKVSVRKRVKKSCLQLSIAVFFGMGPKQWRHTL